MFYEKNKTKTKHFNTWVTENVRMPKLTTLICSWFPFSTANSVLLNFLKFVFS